MKPMTPYVVQAFIHSKAGVALINDIWIGTDSQGSKRYFFILKAREFSTTQKAPKPCFVLSDCPFLTLFEHTRAT